jgi:hypothetical protein
MQKIIRNQNEDEIIQNVSIIEYLETRISKILDIDDMDGISDYNDYEKMTFCCSEYLLAYRTIGTNQIIDSEETIEKLIKIVPNIQILGNQITNEKMISFQPNTNELHNIKFGKKKIVSTILGYNDRLITFDINKDESFKIIKENVQFCEWNKVKQGYLLLITNKQMIIFKSNQNEELVLNFYLPNLHTFKSQQHNHEYIVKAHWSFDGKQIIAKSNKNNIMVFRDDMSFVSSYFDEWSEEFIILTNKKTDKQSCVFSCGNNREIGKFEISCYTLEKNKTPIKTIFEPIKDFQKFDGKIFTFYDDQNDYIYLSMMYQNEIHCLNYNPFTNSITLNQTIVTKNKSNILHMCLSPAEALDISNKEIAR